MNRPTPHEAMVIVARQILANATENVEWEDYPDIGQYDFDRIVSYAKLMAPHPDKFVEALDVLERRAEAFDELVEPCRHGNYARHIVDGESYFDEMSGAYMGIEQVWCDGKPEATDE